MKWYSFRDMHSGGTQKAKYDMYLIEAESEFSAVTVFRAETGRDPNHITCSCCGEDYSIIEWDSREQLMGSMAYERDMKIIEQPEAQVTEAESDLLKALEAIVEACDLLTQVPYEFTIAENAARAAIAKAKGESQ